MWNPHPRSVTYFTKPLYINEIGYGESESQDSVWHCGRGSLVCLLVAGIQAFRGQKRMFPEEVPTIRGLRMITSRPVRERPPQPDHRADVASAFVT